MSKMIHYDLADAGHYRVFTDRLGGEERVRKSYPELFKALIYSRDKAVREASSPRFLLEKSDAEPHGFTDFQGIDCLEYYGGQVSSSSDMGTVSKPQVLSIVSEMKDLFSGTILDSRAEYVQNEQYISSSMRVTTKEQPQYDYTVESTFTKVKKVPSGRSVIDSYAETREVSSKDTGAAIVESITVNDPLPHITKGNRTVIYYNNRRGTGCDYYYDNVDQRDDSVRIMLPFKGGIRLASGFSPLFVDKNKDFDLKIKTKENGGIQFGLSGWGQIVWEHPDANTLTWAFPDDWHNYIYKEGVKAVNEVEFYCKMKVAISLDGKTVMEYVPIVITSGISSLAGNSVKTIPKLEFQWGCFAKSTRIKMADGSYKLISQIRAGERVMTGNGPANVTEVITGTEAKMTVISTASGRTLKVSHDHPVLTGAGWKTADRLTAADVLRTESGLESIEALYTEAYNDKVFSLRTDGEGTLIAEGIFSGDLARQNRTEPPAEEPLDELQQEFADLMERIAREQEARHG